MNILQSVILGIVQGLTEFLPISSSGHLVIFHYLFGIKPALAFVVLVHLGTLVAVVSYFFKDLVSLFLGFLSGLKGMLFEKLGPREVYRRNVEFKLSVLLILGFISTAAVALSLNDFLERLFSSVLAVGVFLLVTGAIIILAEQIGKSNKNSAGVNFLDAVIIGIAQGLAVAPGLSRAGMTISASLSRGLERSFAARFSFLMAVPAILGAGVYEFKDLLSLGSVGIGPVEMLIGFAASVISGYFAIKIFMSLITRMSIRVFAYYCFIIGSAVIFWSFS